MHNYIAAAVVLVFIVVLIPQSAIQTRNHLLISECQAIVEEAKEEAKHEGYFTDAIISDMDTKFTSVGVDPATVTKTLTTTIKYRKNSADETEFIDYEIGIPINEIIAAPGFFGVSDSDNKYIYYFRGTVPSERVVR